MRSKNPFDLPPSVLEFSEMPEMPGLRSWKGRYVAVLGVVVLAAAIYNHELFSLNAANGAAVELSPGLVIKACITWGFVSLILCTAFMIGAAQTPTQFLIYFASAAFGAGMGYLIGAWLTPNSGDQSQLDTARNVVTGLLTGVVGTKLLSLWDDLVDKPAGGGHPPIMTAPYFIPIIMFLVGFTVSLSAFYTVRSQHTDDVAITVSPKSAYVALGSSRLGVLPGAVIQFSGAANSLDDVSVIWDFEPVKACASLDKTPADKTKFDTEMHGAFNLESGKLTTPTLETIETWSKQCPGSQNWTVTATSNENRSKSLQYGVMFCRGNDECVPPTAAAASNAATSGPKGGGSTKDTSTAAKDTASKTGK
jgi:hypothetical protein